MSNLEAVEVLKTTGQIVTLIIARVKDREIAKKNDEATKNEQQQQGLDIELVTSSPPDEIYSTVYFLYCFMRC